MTKPAVPPSASTGEVVEIDAMDGMEWEQGQRTPQASDANLAALVKKTAAAPEPVAAERPRNAPHKARASVAAPAHRGDPAADGVTDPGRRASVTPRKAPARAAGGSAERTARSTPPRDHPRQVTQIGHLGDGGLMAPAVSPRPGRPLTPAPAGVARAGSPPVELATSSAVQALPTPVVRSNTSAGMEAFVPTREYPQSSSDPQAGELAVSSSTMEPLPLSFDDVTSGGPLHRDAPTAPHGSPRSLNDILRAPSRPMRPDGSAAPVVLPLRAPAESTRVRAPLIAHEPALAPPEVLATTEPADQRLGSAAWRRLLLVMGGIAGSGVLVVALVMLAGGKSEPPAGPAFR